MDPNRLVPPPENHEIRARRPDDTNPAPAAAAVAPPGPNQAAPPAPADALPAPAHQAAGQNREEGGAARQEER